LHTIYGFDICRYMGHTKTTVYLDGADYQRLKAIAKRAHRKPAELVRDAVAEYAQRHGAAAPRSLGAGRSGQRNLSERSEELLTGMGRGR
jgi:hypothetical protein